MSIRVLVEYMNLVIECEEKKRIKVKIIEEPAQNQYAASQFDALYGERVRSVIDNPDEKEGLKPKYKSANFSGPSQLEQLNGLCFDYLKNKLGHSKFNVYFLNS